MSAEEDISENEGKIILPRNYRHRRVFQNPDLWRLFTWCLMKASFKERWLSLVVGSGSTEVRIEPGQFVFGRFADADELCVRPSTLYKRMKKLELLGEIAVKSNSHFSVVTVCGWIEMQRLRKRETSEVDVEVAGAKHPAATYKKDDNDNKREPPIIDCTTKGADSLPEKKSWLSPYADAWTKIMKGPFPYGLAAKALHEIHHKEGQAKTLKHLRNYLESLDNPVFVNLFKFVQTFGRWEQPGRRDRQVVPSADYSKGF